MTSPEPPLVRVVEWARTVGAAPQTATQWARDGLLLNAVRAGKGSGRGSCAWLVPAGTARPAIPRGQLPRHDDNAVVEAVVAVRGNLTHAAARLGMTLDGIWKRVERDESLQAAIRERLGGSWRLTTRFSRSRWPVLAGPDALAWWTALSADERGQYVESLFATDGDDRADLAASNLPVG